MATVSFAGVGKVYPDGTRAVHPLDLEVDDGSFTVLIGPSGCGKTTLLRMAAGLEEITEGELRIDGQVVNDMEPRKRDVAMVFQNYALYPHMSVFDNLAFPLAGRVPKSEVKERVTSLATMLGLEELLRRRPRTLSGGQRQRVAMGRALVREPKVFLMDEPLSNLDAKLRVQMRAEIRKLQREVGITTIYVTHDQVEAMTMGSQIAVMRKGVLQQQGPPQELYDAPTTLFVATFLGSPGMNLLRGTIVREGAGIFCAIGAARIDLSSVVTHQHPALVGYDGGAVAVGIRPEHLARPAVSEQGTNLLRGRVQMVEALGAQSIVHVEVPAEPVITDEVIEVAEDVDPSVRDAIEDESMRHLVVVTAVVEGGVQVDENTPIAFAVDPGRMYFFDLDTGDAIR